MRLDMISEADWEEFTEKFTSAHMFLLSASLKGEYESLKKRESFSRVHGHSYLSAWEIKRLAELGTLFRNESNL